MVEGPRGCKSSAGVRNAFAAGLARINDHLQFNWVRSISIFTISHFRKGKKLPERFVVFRQPSRSYSRNQVHSQLQSKLWCPQKPKTDSHTIIQKKPNNPNPSPTGEPGSDYIGLCVVYTIDAGFFRKLNGYLWRFSGTKRISSSGLQISRISSKWRCPGS